MTARAIQCGMLFFFEHPHHEPRVSKTAAFDEFSIHSFANLYRQQLFLVANFLKKNYRSAEGRGKICFVALILQM